MLKDHLFGEMLIDFIPIIKAEKNNTSDSINFENVYIMFAIQNQESKEKVDIFRCNCSFQKKKGKCTKNL